MICPECNGRCETIYYIETDRDESTVTVKQRKGICRTCNGSGEKPMTNADRIRSMTNEELAKLIVVRIKDIHHQGMRELAYSAWMEWLNQPVEKPKEFENPRNNDAHISINGIDVTEFVMCNENE